MESHAGHQRVRHDDGHRRIARSRRRARNGRSHPRIVRRHGRAAVARGRHHRARDRSAGGVRRLVFGCRHDADDRRMPHRRKPGEDRSDPDGRRRAAGASAHGAHGELRCAGRSGGPPCRGRGRSRRHRRSLRDLAPGRRAGRGRSRRPVRGLAPHRARERASLGHLHRVVPGVRCAGDRRHGLGVRPDRTHRPRRIGRDLFRSQVPVGRDERHRRGNFGPGPRDLSSASRHRAHDEGRQGERGRRDGGAGELGEAGSRRRPPRRRGARRPLDARARGYPGPFRSTSCRLDRESDNASPCHHRARERRLRCVGAGRAACRPKAPHRGARRPDRAAGDLPRSLQPDGRRGRGGRFRNPGRGRAARGRR